MFPMLDTDVLDESEKKVYTKSFVVELESKLLERREKVKELAAEVKTLRRKLLRKDSKLEKQKEKLLLKTKVQAVETELKFEKKLQKTEASKKKEKKEVFSLKKSVLRLEKELNLAKENNKKLKCKLKAIEDENSDMKKQVSELLSTQHYLESLLKDDEHLVCYDDITKTYKKELVECALKLTDLNVATRNVSAVIREVAKLCGKEVDRLPTRQNIDSMVLRKVPIAQQQLGTILQSAENMTLYSDETRKYGKTFQTYLVSDQYRNSYLLGLREMDNKSGQCVLDTFREILGDISQHCHQQEQTVDLQHASIGQRILANISNTMSDRASTEKKFNTLFHDYRKEILPTIIENYSNFTDNEQALCSKVNNFFCGLHLLIGLADVCEETLRKFEISFSDEDLGSAVRPELRRYHKNESGTLRLLRTASKAFAVGEDDKNGASLQWKTYLQSKSERNHIIRFKHNRFNMVFTIGQAVYFHVEDIIQFLSSVHGTSNDLLKAVLLDSKQPLFVSGAKALGLLSKFVTAPLWRLIESEGHILDMNLHYHSLVQFLGQASESIEITEGFMTGTNTPFDSSTDQNDKILRKLITPCDDIDSFTVPLLQNLFLAMKETLKRLIPEHLEGGQYWDNMDLYECTKSVLKHNKSPEFIFGQLDHLMNFRPNATSLANEAYLMYSYNKTSSWLSSLSEEEKTRMFDLARKEGREVKKKFKQRIDLIETKRRQKQMEKQRERERLEKERLQKAEELTKEICYYGLWQSEEQINEGLSALGNDMKAITSALCAQIKFRKSVLNQVHKDKKVFNLSKKNANGKYEKLSSQELQANVLKLVHSSLAQETVEKNTVNIPFLVNKTILHKFSDGTYTGKVLGVVPGFPEWYNIKYEDDEAIYVYNLKLDYEKGDLTIVEV